MSGRAIATALAVTTLVGLVVFVERHHLFDPARPASTSSAHVTGTPAEVLAQRDESPARVVSQDERLAALRKARVWKAPKQPIATASLAPEAALGIVECRFREVDLHGTTPKFNCVADTGGDFRVKYGMGSEIPAEAAATKLLTILGFGADIVTLVERLRCFGCPPDPFLTTKVADATHTKPLLERVVDKDDFREYEWVATERKFPARPIETKDEEGWAFFELDTIDPASGAPLAHVDALRLLAVFLAHWDNKAANQRLVCLTKDWPEGTPCRDPFLMLQDVGATFGPKKANLDGWRAAAVWEDRASCTVSMRDHPYGGSTFKSRRISEGGRRFLADLLTQLTDRQMAELFAGARFDERRNILKDSRPVSDWVRVFKAKVEAIATAGPCPQE